MPASDTRQARFERLYDAHIRAVLLYCRRRAGPDVADDVASETFLVAWRRLSEMPDDALPWLFSVARKVLANHRRGDERRRALWDRLTVETTAWVAGPPSADAAVDGEAVRAAVAALPERDREALLLVHWDGLTPAQAARVLGGTPAAMRVRLHRARRRLSRTLATPAASLLILEKGGIR